MCQVASIVPPILTCLIGKRLGDPSTGDHFKLRDLAASLVRKVCEKYGDSSHTLRPRLTRTCLKHFLDPSKPLGTHYGAIKGLAAIGGREAVRILIVPNLKLYENVLRPHLENEMEPEKKRDAEMVVGVVMEELAKLEGDVVGKGSVGEEERGKLKEKTGEMFAERVWVIGKEGVVRAILDA